MLARDVRDARSRRTFAKCDTSESRILSALLHHATFSAGKRVREKIFAAALRRTLRRMQSVATDGATYAQNQVDSLLFFSCCSNPMTVQIDSRSARYRHPLMLGGQQWRSAERKQLRRKQRRSGGRRSRLRRDRSSASHVSEIASHGPAHVEGGSMIARDGPAQVNDGGRRRDGGKFKPRPSRRRPRYFGGVVQTLSPASRRNAAAPFSF